ncbi:cocosin 1-like [Carex rostrata]
MAASSSFLCFSLCLLLLCHGAFAQVGFGGPWQSPRSFAGPRGCRFDRLDALNPTQRLRFEAGTIEYYDESNEVLQCAGVSARRTIIEPRGLFLPQFNNAPSLVYITQGRCIKGITFPGCPETFQSFQQEADQFQSQQRLRDEHQKVHRLRQGDIIALPAGVSYWCYNDGDIPVVAVQVFDLSNTANQLEPRRRNFFLAGRHQSGQWTTHETGQQTSFTGQETFEMGQLRDNNILNGFDTRMLAEAFGVNIELARRLQSQTDKRGEIVFVPQGLRMLRPSRSQEVQQQEFEESMQGQEQYRERMQGQEEYYGESMQGQWNITTNGLDEAFCTMKIRSNIDKPSRADYFNKRVGRVARVDSQKLPILNLVQMSATRVVLQRNAMITPYWSMNCHCGMYVTGGQGRVQVVNHQGRTVFDGLVRQGQFLLIPQNFAVLKRAESEGFHWVTFNTNQNAMINQIAGKFSTFRAMPLQVLMNSYRLSIEQARRLKFSRRDEFTLFRPTTAKMIRDQ